MGLLLGDITIVASVLVGLLTAGRNKSLNSFLGWSAVYMSVYRPSPPVYSPRPQRPMGSGTGGMCLHQAAWQRVLRSRLPDATLEPRPQSRAGYWRIGAAMARRGSGLQTQPAGVAPGD